MLSPFVTITHSLILFEMSNTYLGRYFINICLFDVKSTFVGKLSSFTVLPG